MLLLKKKKMLLLLKKKVMGTLGHLVTWYKFAFAV